MNIIEVENLTQDYGHGRGVFDVSFSVQKGEVFGFLGPNGAGKSTTIRHIMGFSKPQGGSVRVFGKEAFEEYDKILANVGYLPGEIALPQGLTGKEFIDMMGKLRKSKNDKMLSNLLDMFSLNTNTETKRMSLGDKRKLAIITAFMDDPDVLILDEPTSGLDPIMQQKFIDFIKDEKKRGKTILLSSHIFNEVEATCDRIAIIKDGKIVSTFDADEIKHNQNKTFELYFKDKGALKKFLDKIKSVDFMKVVTADESLFMAKININDEKINELLAIMKDFEVVRFTQDKFTLEDYFMQFYREDINYGEQL